MLVKAKWNVKDASGWHAAGEVFNTEKDFGDAVEVLDAPVKAPEAEKEQEPAKETEKASEQVPEAPRSTSRRKKASK